METQDKRELLKGLVLLLAIVAVLAGGVRAFAQEQDSSGQSNDLTELSIDELMNIEVASTATLTKTAPRLVPAAMTTITDEQIKASGARSLFELLDIYVPNLQWIRNHWEADHLGLRGIFGENKYLLLVNGRVMNEFTHFGAMSERDLPMLSDIHHIDVVRGPGSALYGPGAVSMVINMVTFNAETFQGTEFISRLGAVEEFYTGEVKHGQKFDDNEGGVFLYAGVGKFEGADQHDAPQVYGVDFPSGPQLEPPLNGISWWGDDIIMPSDGYQAGEPYLESSISNDGETHRNLPPLKFHVEITRDNWDIWARYTRGGKQFVWQPRVINKPPFGWVNIWPYMDYSSTWPYPQLTAIPPIDTYSSGYQQATGFIGKKFELADNLDVDTSFSYDMFDFERVIDTDWIKDAFREDHYYGKALVKWQPNDRHQIAFGSEILHKELGLKSPGWPNEKPRTYAFVTPSDSNGFMPRWSTNLYSLLGEWQWTISDNWTTFLGARLDDHTYTDWMFSPRAAIVFTPNEKDTFKTIWSRSVRANFEGQMKSQAMQTDAPNNSEPEKLDSVELRYERQHNENLDLAASFFVHYNLEVIDWSQSDMATIPVGTQKEYGIELEASYHTEKTRLLLSHSYTKLYDFKLNDPCVLTYTSTKDYGYGDDLTNWSNHLTKVVLEQKLNDQWTFDASLRIYWGFPGMQSLNEYLLDNTQPDGYWGTVNPVVEQGWKKNSRGNYFLNLGLRYQPSKDLTIGITGYNLLGIFDKDLNKRNYLNDADYRSHAPAVGVSLEYKF
jgi:iron complex outermembrane receptor protein